MVVTSVKLPEDFPVALTDLPYVTGSFKPSGLFPPALQK
ncbi:hypothetical protein EC2846750_2210 [Escherichia coli 2846750]|nr:hypothetical protein EC2872000_2517 [Escherichia coli 2872000]EMV58571.1 hypothetical protein EC2871950_2397 [Escherichia coli 2871950]EMZ70901.1 hypothetical protein EC2846750_2210 [Escherichia coli 2846750]